MSLALPLLVTYASYVKNRFIRSTQQVMTTQEQFLRDLLTAHQHTELGQTLGLKQIKTIDQFREHIPIWSYVHYEPFCDRIVQGESHVLNPEPVLYIHLSGGSTGQQKRVPVTRQFQRILQQADLTSLGFAVDALQRRQRKLGKFCITDAVPIQGRTPAGIEFGSLSASRVHRGKLLYQQTLAQPLRALEIHDTLARHYVCLLFALRNPDLRAVMADFPTLILRSCNYLECYAEALIYDLERGTIAPWLKLEPEIRADLEKHWSAAPKRAAHLRAILRTEGRLTPQLAWTDLGFVTTAQGGTSGLYLDRFSDYFGDTPVFGGLYSSAEAVLSVYPDFDMDSGILAIESGFFEFIPVDQEQVEQPKTLLANEVKVGDRYRMLVTNYSGFYRYDLGDVVEVVGFYEQTPLITFCYRYGSLLSSTTEQTTEFHVVQVMRQLQREFHVYLDDFCVTLPNNELPARYVLNIELTNQSKLNDPVAFLHRFDDWLREFNPSYHRVRGSQVPSPQLRILSSGSFAKLRQRQAQQGRSGAPLKTTHISEDQNCLSNLLILQEVDFDSVLPQSWYPDRNGAGSQGQLRWVNGTLKGANLVRINLSQMDLSGVDLSYADLSGANLSGTNLTGANLRAACLQEADLTYADLTEASLNKANLIDANLFGACLRLTSLEGANLTRTNLKRADLTDAYLHRAFLQQCDLSEANLTNVGLSDSQLRQTQLNVVRPDLPSITTRQNADHA